MDAVRFNETLPGGLRVAGEARPHGSTFAASLIVKSGSLNDTPGAPGAAHLAEHLLISGVATKEFEDLAAEGAEVNALTDRDCTYYMVHGHVDQLPAALEMLAKILYEHRFSSEDFERERRIVKAELGETDPHNVASRQVAHEQFWGRLLNDPNAKLSPGAKLRKVGRLTEDHVNAFVAAYYLPDNSSVSVVASVAREELIQRLRQAFGSPVDPRKRPSRAPRQTAKQKRLTVSFDTSHHAWVNLVSLSTDTSSVMRLAGSMLAHQLGGNPNSEFFKWFRTIHGELYHVGASCDAWLHFTNFQTLLSIRKRKLFWALDFLLGRMDELHAHGISEEEFHRAKVSLRRQSQMLADDAQRYAASICYANLRTQPDGSSDPWKTSKRLESLTHDQANQAIQELLAPENRRLFVGGRVWPMTYWRLRRRMR